MQVILKYPGLHSCFSSRMFCSIIVLISKQVLGNVGEFLVLCKHSATTWYTCWLLPEMNPTGPNVLLQGLLASCSVLWDELPKGKLLIWSCTSLQALYLNACFTKSSAALSGLSHSNWENCSSILFMLAPNSCFNDGKIYLLSVRMLQRLYVHPRN